MPPQVDPAILRALSIDNNDDKDASNVKIESHGGSNYGSTYRLSTPRMSYFVKTSSASGAEDMFKGEYASLNAIYGVVPSLCPRALACGQLDDSGGNNRGYFLATEFLDMNVRGGRQSSNSLHKTQGSGSSLAQKLAKLHSTPAPIPEGYDTAQFGFHVVTCCGDTPQPNDFRTSWAEFFAENRLMAILERAERNHGKKKTRSGDELRKLVEQVVEKVVPRLLGDDHLGGSEGPIVPVITHGDLWSGNKTRASFVGRKSTSSNQSQPSNQPSQQPSDPDSNPHQDINPSEEEREEEKIIEEVIFDPCVTYAHSEYDHGIMNMFGGFSTSFWNEYFSILPKTQPVDEYEDRVTLYESYHHLNHFAMFGGEGYRNGAVSLLGRLVGKYAR